MLNGGPARASFAASCGVASFSPWPRRPWRPAAQAAPPTPEPQNTCTTLLDCQAGYDCVDGHCYLKSDGDGEGQGCQSTLDCGNNEYCDPVWKKCRSLPADLDESDTDSDSDGTIEHDDEAVTPDGDPDADTEDSSPEVDQDTALLVSFSQPPSGAVVDGQVALTLLIQGPKSPDSVQLFAGTTLLTEWTAPPYTYLWDCNSSAEGPLTLRAVAHLNGTEFTGLLDLVLDHSAPTLQITSPAANGEEWSCEHEGTLKLTAGDHLRKLVVTVDGSVLSTLDSFGADPAFSFDLPASAKTPGNHTVSVRAEDLLGHAAANASSSYHIDDTPPKLVIQGPTFDPSAPKNGTIHVSQPLSITVEDASALKSVFITLRDSQFHTLKNISSAAELPYTLTDYDSILYNPDPASGNAIYPLDLTLLATVQDSCGNTYTTSDTEPYQIQVNRLAWSFDLTQHDPLFVPDGSYNQSTGAAIDHRGNITVGLFDHLIGLTPQGALRFNCTLRDGMDQLTTAATTPVIAQGEPGSDLPPLILVLANDGALWLRVDDPSLDGCLRLPSDALTTDLAPPSVEAPQAIDGGVTYTFVLCGQNKAARTNSRCQRLTLTHLFLPGVGQERDSLSVIWQRDYLNFSPPTSPPAARHPAHDDDRQPRQAHPHPGPQQRPGVQHRQPHERRHPDPLPHSGAQRDHCRRRQRAGNRQRAEHEFPARQHQQQRR